MRGSAWDQLKRNLRLKYQQSIRQDKARGNPSRSLQQNRRHFKASAPGHGFSKSPIRRMVNWHLLRAPSRTVLICGIFNTHKSAR